MPRKTVQSTKKRDRSVENSYGMMTRAKRRKIEEEKNNDDQKKSKENKIQRRINLMVSEHRKNDETNKINDVKNTYKYEIEKKRRLIVILKQIPDDVLNKARGLNNDVVLNKNKDKPESTHMNLPEISSNDDSKSQPNNIIVPFQPDFVLNEIVWAKIRGFVCWPAKIDRVIAANRGATKYVVLWYNDYRRTTVFKSQIFKFLDSFEKFATKFDDVIGLKTAAFEAMYEYRQNMK